MNKVLRDYQKNCYSSILGYLSRNISCVLCLPTGAGKTVIASSVVSILAERNLMILITVHRRELLRQMSASLSAVEVDHGILAAGERPSDHLVQIASIDTLRARLNKGNLVERLDQVRLLVIDEAHHAASASWTMVASACRRAVRLGLTATPWRLDGKPLAHLFDGVVRGPTIRDLTADGYLVPARVIAPPNDLDLSTVRKVAGDYHQGQLAELIDTDIRTRTAVRAYGKWLPGRPAIAFCVSVDHCHHVASAFMAAGWRARPVDGSMSMDERDAAIGGLATGATQVLTSCQIVSEGTDIPECAGAILMRPTLSCGLHLQQVGRTLRTAAGKASATIIDLAGNCAAHGLPEQERTWSLRDGLAKTQMAAAGLIRCRHCWRLFEVATQCPECGAAPRRQAAGISPSRLTPLEIQMTSYQRLVECAQSHDDLRRIAAARGYKDGWVHHVAAEKGIRI